MTFYKFNFFFFFKGKKFYFFQRRCCFSFSILSCFWDEWNGKGETKTFYFGWHGMKVIPTSGFLVTLQNDCLLYKDSSQKISLLHKRTTRFLAFFWDVIVCPHSPWTKQSTSPSPPPSSPRRLAPPHRMGWSCTGGAGTCRVPSQHEANDLGQRALHLQTLIHRGRLRNDTDETESEKKEELLK